MKKNICLVTLGCAKNTVYSEYMMGLTETDPRFALIDDPNLADIIIVNTCGFITSAKEQSINTLLTLSEMKEEGRCEMLVAVGCFVQKYADELKKEMPEVDLFIGTNHYDDVLDIIANHAQLMGGESFSESAYNAIITDAAWQLPAAKGYNTRRITTPARYAFVSIAEGCDNHCSYCAIPDMQGTYRSRTMEDIFAEVEGLVDQGYTEIILIAQDTTYYGKDIYGTFSLDRLLTMLCKIEKLHWIRLLYAYPNNFTDDLIDVLAREPKICHYLDIPFQHGDDQVLADMNRRITSAEMLNLVTQLRANIPDIVLRSTFITGFPGETEAQFENMIQFLKTAKLDRVGVFPYSQEEDTIAAARVDQVPEDIREARAEILMEEQYQIMSDRHDAMLGRTVEVKVDEISEDVENLLICRSYGEAPDIDPYILVQDDENRYQPGDYFMVRLTERDEYDLIGEMIDEPA